MTMIISEFAREALRFRRERRKPEKEGYRMHETDWELLRGFKTDHIIADVKISCDGKHVWTKIEKR